MANSQVSMAWSMVLCTQKSCTHGKGSHKTFGLMSELSVALRLQKACHPGNRRKLPHPACQGGHALQSIVQSSSTMHTYNQDKLFPPMLSVFAAIADDAGFAYSYTQERALEIT